MIQLYSQITQFCSNKWSLTWKDELVCFSPRCISKLSSVGILYCKIIEHTDATSLNRVVLFVYIGHFAPFLTDEQCGINESAVDSAILCKKLRIEGRKVFAASIIISHNHLFSYSIFQLQS